jgi:hypothetical protein
MPTEHQWTSWLRGTDVSAVVIHDTPTLVRSLHAKLDKEVLKSISKKIPRPFGELHRIRVNLLAEPIHFRRLDASLQRLRKAGKIKHVKKAELGPGWVRA